MFVCPVTGKCSLPGEKPTQVVLERRERVYTRTQWDQETNEEVTIEIGRGWEIVRELFVSREGLRRIEAHEAGHAAAQ